MESTPTATGAQLPKDQGPSSDSDETAFAAQLQQLLLLQQTFQMQIFFDSLVESLWLDQDDDFY